MKYFTTTLILTGLLIHYPTIPALSQPFTEQSQEQAPEVNLSKNINQITINTSEEVIVIKRNSDPMHTIEPPFDKTSRPCPPFCIQPIKAAAGVETIGELELIEFIQKLGNNDHVLIIDTRASEWYKRKTIPLAINFPKQAFMENLPRILQNDLGVNKSAEDWDYTNAKTLVIFCNGYWNPDSYEVIKQLIAQGYPADKIKWYRAGMQGWLSLGLTTK